MSEQNTGQVRIPEVTHLTQGAEQVVRIQVPGLRSQCFSYDSTSHITSLQQHRQHGDQHAVNRHHVTASTSHQPNCSFRALFGRGQAGHGPVLTDENNAFFVPRAEAGDHNMYSLLQLSGIGSGGIRRERLSDI